MGGNVARTLTVRVAVLLAAEKAQIRDGGRVDKVAQIAEDDARAADVARLELLHRLDHCQRYLVVIWRVGTWAHL